LADAAASNADGAAFNAAARSSHIQTIRTPHSAVKNFPPADSNGDAGWARGRAGGVQPQEAALFLDNQIRRIAPTPLPKKNEGTAAIFAI
jgi:hypothetical protein